MTEAQMWTIISGAGTVSLAFLAYLSTEIRDNTRSIRDVLVKMERHDSNFERIDERFDRLEAIAERQADHLYQLAKKLDDHLRWHAS